MRGMSRLWVAVLVVTSACGSGTTQSVSSQGRTLTPAVAGPPAATAGAADTGTLATRWRVVKTAPTEVLFKAGDVVEFRPGGGFGSGAGLVIPALIWKLEGDRLALQTPAGPVSYAISIRGDVLRLVDLTGKSDVLRRFLGPADPPPAATSTLQEGQFLSLLSRGRVESATLTQSATVITVTGVYNGPRNAERYTVTLRDCKSAQSLETAFRTNGVLTDGVPPSEVQC